MISSLNTVFRVYRTQNLVNSKLHILELALPWAFQLLEKDVKSYLIIVIMLIMTMIWYRLIGCCCAIASGERNCDRSTNILYLTRFYTYLGIEVTFHFCAIIVARPLIMSSRLETEWSFLVRYGIFYRMWAFIEVREVVKKAGQTCVVLVKLVRYMWYIHNLILVSVVQFNLPPYVYQNPENLVLFSQIPTLQRHQVDEMGWEGERSLPAVQRSSLSFVFSLGMGSL